VRRGLTLIELLVVIAIIGTLLAFVVPAVRKVRETATTAECRNNLRNLGAACLQFVDKYGYYPRNTVRPRGTTTLNAEPPGNLNHWGSGTFESWIRQVAPFIDQSQAITQDAIPALACPADPRGTTYKVAAYGFTWYIGVYSNPSYRNDGILIDDSFLRNAFTVTPPMISDGLSNTILLGERPPPGDGQWGWWDSACCIQDTLSPVRGDRTPYSSGTTPQGTSKNCPAVALYEPGAVVDNCAFNAIWSLHVAGGNFCMGDGSVRTISYQAANRSAGINTLIEALATRGSGDTVSFEE
jgi:prepilin-type N-terminal cleavage/methylation domain-containing protein